MTKFTDAGTPARTETKTAARRSGQQIAGRNMIQLGDRVKDTITGITGIAVAKTIWLHGCERITIQPEKLNEGKVPDSVTFDEPQLQLVKPAVTQRGRVDTGGPRPEPQRQSDPAR